MRVGIRSEGGFGGLRVGGEVDTADLPKEMAEEVESLLRPEVLVKAEHPDPQAPSSIPDAQRYEVFVEEDGRRRRFLLDQTTAPGELMQLLHNLHAEVVRRRIAERRSR